MGGEKNSWYLCMCVRLYVCARVCMQVCVCVCVCVWQTCGKKPAHFLSSLFFFGFSSASISLCLPVSASTTDWLITQPGMRDSFYRYNVAIVIIKWRLS